MGELDGGGGAGAAEGIGVEPQPREILDIGGERIVSDVRDPERVGVLADILDDRILCRIDDSEVAASVLDDVGAGTLKLVIAAAGQGIVSIAVDLHTDLADSRNGIGSKRVWIPANATASRPPELARRLSAPVAAARNCRWRLAFV